MSFYQEPHYILAETINVTELDVATSYKACLLVVGSTVYSFPTVNPSALESM